MSKYVPFIVGGVLIATGVAAAAGVAIVGVHLSLATALTIAAAGAGQVIAGAGTLLNHPRQGLTTAARNPIMPHNVIYGRAATGGKLELLD